jgi:hypothetical protein
MSVAGGGIVGADERAVHRLALPNECLARMKERNGHA